MIPPLAFWAAWAGLWAFVRLLCSLTVLTTRCGTAIEQDWWRVTFRYSARGGGWVSTAHPTPVCTPGASSSCFMCLYALDWCGEPASIHVITGLACGYLCTCPVPPPLASLQARAGWPTAWALSSAAGCAAGSPAAPQSALWLLAPAWPSLSASCTPCCARRQRLKGPLQQGLDPSCSWRCQASPCPPPMRCRCGWHWPRR